MRGLYRSKEAAASTIFLCSVLSIFTRDYRTDPDWITERFGELLDEPTIQQQSKQPQQPPQQQQRDIFYEHHQERIGALINESTILTWGPREKPTPFGSFFDYFKEDDDLYYKERKYVYGDICRSAKMLLYPDYVPRPHVLFLTPFNENWGQLSTAIPNRTTQFWNLTLEWKRNKCRRDHIYKFLNHNTTRGVITNQFQDLDHPKVHSIPLGLNTPQVPHILNLITKQQQQQQQQQWGSNRTRLLMINSKPRVMRLQLLENVLHNFNGTVKNTYGATMERYYEEMQQSKFILSPGGLGLDCYRHWEALYLGTIPVVEHLNRKDGWQRTLQHLPVAWIDHYDNLTSQWLEQEYDKILAKAKTYQYEKLTKQYWIQLIQSLAPQLKT